MKRTSIFSTVLLLSVLFICQTAQAQQWLQNATSKSITTNGEFNAAPGAKLGIGTATPTNAKLEVQGAVGNTIASFRTGANSKGVSLVGDWPGLYFNAYFNAGAKTMSSGYAGIVNFDPDNGRIDFGITGAAATATNAAVTMTNRMCINKDGKVGIGTSAPVSQLDISGNQNALRVGGFEPYITLHDQNSTKSARIQAAHGDLGFFNMAAGQTVAYPQMVIKDSGNVGIGIAEPASKLHVNGAMTINKNWDGVGAININGDKPSIWFNSGQNNNKWLMHVGSDFGGAFALFSNSGPIPALILTPGTNGTGRVGISTLKVPAGYKLAVGGKIICEELKVQLQNAWPDYVFASGYALQPLEAVAQHIAEKGHLPNIPSACEMEENGLSVGEMQTKMMEKIEELTLYLIDQNKRLRQLEQENASLRGRLDQSDATQK